MSGQYLGYTITAKKVRAYSTTAVDSSVKVARRDPAFFKPLFDVCTEILIIRVTWTIVSVQPFL